MSTTHNAGPDDEISDADAEAEISDASDQADEGSNENAANSAAAAVGTIAGRSATDPRIINH